ncbi:MAG: hypothetical protein KAS72_13690 [Phycisphaerales bacterium]|nr:hypothetical protein [Phycisphaerales bacterium]
MPVTSDEQHWTPRFHQGQWLAHRAGRAVWAEILDYKTDRITPGDAQARIEYYRPQIRAYRRAAAHVEPIT